MNVNQMKELLNNYSDDMEIYGYHRIRHNEIQSLQKITLEEGVIYSLPCAIEGEINAKSSVGSYNDYFSISELAKIQITQGLVVIKDECIVDQSHKLKKLKEAIK